MKLKYQLFLALLAGGGMLILLLAAYATWSFERGFLDYVNRIEHKRLEPLSADLVDGYTKQGDWSWITTDDNKRWRSLIKENIHPDGRRERRSNLQRSLILADADKTILISRDNRPRGSESRENDRRNDDRLGGHQQRSDKPRDERRRDEPRATESQVVNWSPLKLNDQIIGYLGNLPLRRAPPGLDQLFAERQRRSLVYASLALLPLSALMAWVLTTRIVRPLKQLNSAIARIGDGEFSERLPATRRDELGDLSRQVNRLAGALESNLHARQRWLAEISHELRTPVAVLQAELEAMQDGVINVDDAALNSLHSETTRLSRLIDDLRDLTLADAGALNYQFKRLDFARLVTDLLNNANNRLVSAELTLKLGDSSPLLIDADEQRINQLINNLLQNSLRYTDAGGTLEIAIHQQGDHVQMLWADSAPGVPEADLPQLFDPLYRADASRHRDSGGSGLGLAIVEKIAEAHGGRIHARPSVHGGLAIELHLPLASQSTAGIV